MSQSTVPRVPQPPAAAPLAPAVRVLQHLLGLVDDDDQLTPDQVGALAAETMRARLDREADVGPDGVPATPSRRDLDEELLHLRQVRSAVTAAELLGCAALVSTAHEHQFLPDGTAVAEPDELVDEAACLSTAMRLSTSPATLRHQVTLAHVAVNDLPECLHALADDALPLSTLRQLLDLVRPLDHQGRAHVDHRLAVEARTRLLSPRHLLRAARRIVAAYDPTAHSRRCHRARRNRGTRLTPHGDGTATLAIRGRAEDSQAAYQRLHHDARTRANADDPRTPSAQITDLALDRLIHPGANHHAETTTGAAEIDRAEPTGGGPSGGTDPDRTAITGPDPGAGGYTVELQVVISVSALLGCDDEPAHLNGHGSIPADLARQLATDHGTWIRQLLTDPDDGHLRRISSRRAFPDDMRAFLLAQTGGDCAIEACTRRADHIDHVRDHHRGGPTAITNGQPLCAVHNDLKTAAGIVCRKRHTDSAVIWTFPNGRTRTQHPPPPLGPGSGPNPEWEDPDDVPF